MEVDRLTNHQGKHNFTQLHHTVIFVHFIKGHVQKSFVFVAHRYTQTEIRGKTSCSCLQINRREVRTPSSCQRECQAITFHSAILAVDNETSLKPRQWPIEDTMSTGLHNIYCKCWTEHLTDDFVILLCSYWHIIPNTKTLVTFGYMKFCTSV